MEASVLMVIGLAILLVGSICFAYRLYEIVQIDARSRGFKHPKTWGLFSISSNNGSGLLLYLIKRRKYPIIELSKEDMERIEKGKKAISAHICCNGSNFDCCVNYFKIRKIFFKSLLYFFGYNALKNQRLFLLKDLIFLVFNRT